MNKDVIYPTMVIRSQAETIELQEKEIEKLNQKLEENTKIYLNTSKYASEMEGKYILEKAKNEKAIEELDKYINSCGIEAEHTLNNEKCLISINHSKKVKNILNGGEKE